MNAFFLRAPLFQNQCEIPKRNFLLFQLRREFSSDLPVISQFIICSMSQQCCFTVVCVCANHLCEADLGCTPWFLPQPSSGRVCDPWTEIQHTKAALANIDDHIEIIFPTPTSHCAGQWCYRPPPSCSPPSGRTGAATACRTAPASRAS